MSKFKIYLEEKVQKFNEFKDSLTSWNWDKIFVILSVYIGGFFGLYYIITFKAKLLTYWWTYNIFTIGGIGLGPGAHRYFAHRSYKATRGFKLFLIFCQTVAGQYSILLWSRVHRVHHKYADTEKDPTNINRGFLFAHIFWLFRHTPECKKALDTVDLTDLLSDKDVMFQERNLLWLNFIFCIFLPTIIPYYLWNETLWISFWANMFRWLLNYNQMGFANSLMHMYGKRPYDGKVSAAENLFCIAYTYGEGYHNYHHVFPWDYKAAEFGDFASFNISTLILDYCAEKGWVYDRKVVTKNMIERRKARTGDGSHWLESNESLKNPLWGYGDVDMDVDDKMELHGYVFDSELNNNNNNEGDSINNS